LNLTNAPIGPIRMDYKITKAEIKQKLKSCGLIHEKYSKELSLFCDDKLVAGKPIQRNKSPRNIAFNCGYQEGKRVRER